VPRVFTALLTNVSWNRCTGGADAKVSVRNNDKFGWPKSEIKMTFENSKRKDTSKI